MVNTRKPTEEDLSAVRSFVAELPVPKYSIGKLVRLFRKILTQPNIQSVTFAAGEPVRVTYHAHPLEEDLEKRIFDDVTPEQLLARIAAKPLTGDAYHALVHATCHLQEAGLEPSHLLFRDRPVVAELGVPDSTDSFLGMALVEHAVLPDTLLMVCGSASAAGSLADVQMIYSVML